MFPCLENRSGVKHGRKAIGNCGLIAITLAAFSARETEKIELRNPSEHVVCSSVFFKTA